MLFLFGLRLFGSTDSVSVGRGDDKKPLFHVATQFFHINFVPLCPFTSYLVLDFLPSSRRRCVQVPLSCKSIGIAWLRLLSWLASFAFGLITLGGIIDLSNINSRDPFPWEFLPCFFLSVGFASFVTWHSLFNDASHDRALELLEQMNLGERLDDIFRRMIDDSFGDAQCIVDESEYQALAYNLPTATAELVDGWGPRVGLIDGRVRADVNASNIPNDLELCEAPPENVPSAVAVAQPLPQQSEIQTAKYADETGRKGDVDFENESQFSIA